MNYRFSLFADTYSHISATPLWIRGAQTMQKSPLLASFNNQPATQHRGYLKDNPDEHVQGTIKDHIFKMATENKHSRDIKTWAYLLKTAVPVAC